MVFGINTLCGEYLTGRARLQDMDEKEVLKDTMLCKRCKVSYARWTVEQASVST